MRATSESARARRYLLGDVSSEESAALEQEFFERPDVVDRVAAVEDDLIEDYLGDHLNAADRDRFERSYLASDPHRVRVETVRRLMAVARSTPRRRQIVYKPWLALAASLLIAGSVAIWMLSPIGKRSGVAGTPQPAPTVAGGERLPQQTPLPRAFALTLSPVTVRSGSDSPAAIIPAGTDVVTINLESDGENRRLTPSRAVVRLVSGREVWQGPVLAGALPSSALVARIDVPAGKLPPDDYVIALYGASAAGTEVEWAQYYLRVRGR